MLVRELTSNAKSLLAKLRDGGNVANAPANIGEFAYSALARAFLSNAKMLCVDDRMSDFRVYGALYSLRHGLELMLKCIVRNDLMDTTLRALMREGIPFAEVCTELKLKGREKALLQQSLCTLRNVLQDRITFPDCKTKNVDLASAERALAYLRSHPSLPRNRFAVVWSVTAGGHDLAYLWEKAVPTVEMMAADANRHAQEIGYDPPCTKEALEQIVELLSALDDGGDGFRYPSALNGAWYVALPAISLDAVGELALKLEETCIIFESVRQQCYEMATVGHPTPQYSG